MAPTQAASVVSEECTCVPLTQAFSAHQAACQPLLQCYSAGKAFSRQVWQGAYTDSKSKSTSRTSTLLNDNQAGSLCVNL